MRKSEVESIVVWVLILALIILSLGFRVSACQKLGLNVFECMAFG